MKKIFLAIPMLLYSLVLRIRHWLFDSGVIKKHRFEIPVICIGNITVGGTGKTPVVEFLVDRLGRTHTIAVLSRGYGRRTKGYMEVSVESSFLDVGDEPKQMKHKYPDLVVVVCENRTEGIRRIQKEHPEVNMILMDDGFQHRRVDAKVNIVLADYTRPICDDYLLPVGSLRDLKSQLFRANIVLITKTPENLSPIDRRIAVKSLKLYPFQSVYFTSMVQHEPIPLFPDMAPAKITGRNVAAMAGIGNPASFVSSLEEKYNVTDSFIFRDHHIYKVRELNDIVEKLRKLPQDTVIITTEKDGVKLTNRKKIPEELQKRLYVIPVELNFPEKNSDIFIKNIHQDLKPN